MAKELIEMGRTKAGQFIARGERCPSGLRPVKRYNPKTGRTTTQCVYRPPAKKKKKRKRKMRGTMGRHKGAGPMTLEPYYTGMELGDPLGYWVSEDNPCAAPYRRVVMEMNRPSSRNPRKRHELIEAQCVLPETYEGYEMRPVGGYITRAHTGKGKVRPRGPYRTSVPATVTRKKRAAGPPRKKKRKKPKPRPPARRKPRPKARYKKKAGRWFDIRTGKFVKEATVKRAKARGISGTKSASLGNPRHKKYRKKYKKKYMMGKPAKRRKTYKDKRRRRRRMRGLGRLGLGQAFPSRQMLGLLGGNLTGSAVSTFAQVTLARMGAERAGLEGGERGYFWGSILPAAGGFLFWHLNRGNTRLAPFALGTFLGALPNVLELVTTKLAIGITGGARIAGPRMGQRAFDAGRDALTSYATGAQTVIANPYMGQQDEQMRRLQALREFAVRGSGAEMSATRLPFLK